MGGHIHFTHNDYYLIITGEETQHTVYILHVGFINTHLSFLSFPGPQVLDTNGSSLVLAAENEEDLTRWMQALCMAAIDEDVSLDTSLID